ncbi:S1C family serine protease [Thalassotalea atypica]|uniref:S1C family serine protease n=1 Tax=Thalassotalea atypica TaxID=2054316 RepID=UPI002572DAEE|nr:trypsin-like peptidase domain-containing protein [Thalassotalea atypica]
MKRIVVSFLALIYASYSFADNKIQKLYDSVNNSVVELHVEAIANPKPGQVNYKVSKANSLGSGALVSKKGRILTAAHVVERATKIEVTFNDGSKTSGHVVWVDNLIDLAMIQAAEVPDNIKPLKLAKAEDYRVGEQVMVIGAPYGVSHSLSVGYLSGIRDKDPIPGTGLVPRFLQTDASINKGNSGGPMFNLDGEILGIVSHILSKTGDSIGLGFVISTDTIQKIMATDPTIFSGLIPHLLTKKEAKAINNPYGYGLLIQQVVPGTIADRLGFRGGDLNVLIGNTPVLLGGDILLEISGRPIKDLASALKLRGRLTEYAKGDKIIVKYLRAGEVKQTFWIIE